jgi:DNA polymerase III subunit alpha
MSSFSHLHAHSHFSTTDAIQTVDQMVGAASKWKQPAMALTDHGNMSGTVQLYKAGKKYGVQVFPGFEGYLVEDHTDAEAKRYHYGVLATTLNGFRALSRFSSLSHTRPRYNRFPRHDLADLADLADDSAADDVLLLTGCYFGFVQQTLVHKGEKEAQRVVEMYANWFSNTFVEIQNHSIVHNDGNNWTDDSIVEALVDIADRVGLPVVATQDSHYLKPDDKDAHSTMKRMVYRQGDASEFPGDTFHFASTGWVKRHYTEDQWNRSEEGHALVLSMHDFEMPALDNYKPFVPKMANNPVRQLTKLTDAALAKFLADGRSKGWKKYTDRLTYELRIINQLGYADYFLHVLDIVDFCARKKITIEARGSANASLVCFLLGITQVDPFQQELIFDKNPLTFERFLSPDRQKPPDIDIDIEDKRRGELVDYVRGHKYHAISIGNYSVLGSREEDGKGSILVTYNAYLRSKMSPADFNYKFGKGIDSIEDIKRFSKKDYIGVKRLAQASPLKSYGVHAAGLLLPGGHMKLEDYVPTMLVPSSDTIVSQYTMDDVEMLGYLKDDVLGQRTLWVMARCLELMGRKNKNDFSWIPYDDALTCKMLSEGRVNNAVFQFEGYTMAKGARSMGIKNTRDCILAAALFRPACMEGGVTELYLRRRSQAALRSNIHYPHPAFEDALKSTHGLVLFQEQVLQIMRSLGLDYAGINTFFKIVKDSGKGATARNIERAAEVKKTWSDICHRNGITDVEGAWGYIEGYVKYGFNQAHATGYGVRSYRCAYLKTHYSLEFMTAVLESVAGDSKKEPPYVMEARRIGIRILPPDINISGGSWTLDHNRKAITKGIASISGISSLKAEAIVAQRPPEGWKDVRDLAESLPAGILTGRQQYLDLVDGKMTKKRTGELVPTGAWIGVMKALKEAGALESLGVGRDD